MQITATSASSAFKAVKIFKRGGRGGTRRTPYRKQVVLGSQRDSRFEASWGLWETRARKGHSVQRRPEGAWSDSPQIRV